MAEPPQKTPATILEEVETDPHVRVKVAIADLDGVLRGKSMHKQKFAAAAKKGFGFCNVVFGWDMADECYASDKIRYTGWHTGYPDAQARIDLGTYRRIPWEEDVAFFLADFIDDQGTPLAVCPRQLLKRVIAQAAEQGYTLRAGFEFEWFNFQETPGSLADRGARDPDPLTPGMFGYSMLRSSQNKDYFHALMEDLGAFGVPIEGLHTETGPGVFEAAIVNAEALEAADRALLFKQGTKEIAYRFGVLASFMAKWNGKLPGCGGHVHQSLWSADGANLFFDADRAHGLSPVFESYVAGQLALLPELCVLYAPTVNSYKRLVDGLWAPTKATWGIDNRTVALRAIPGSEGSTRLETRVPGSDVNPYLALAAAFASGLHGVEQGLKLEAAPIRGNGYTVKDAPTLPGTLGEAADRFAESEVARALFGDAFVDHYAETRRWEWRQFRLAVTDWELARYFELT